MKLFAVRAVLIVLISVGLFFIADFFVAVPALERIVMDQKKEMIRELTNSAWNILAKFENDERSGILSRHDAQQQAIIQIQNLHYGIELKDYFWINDMHPRMVIHPYRSDLNGTDLTGFTDPQGKKLFLEAVRVVKEQGAGYITYMWQWMDNSDRIVPKISYVKGFEPWGWVIGTGVYIDDIQQEIQTARRNVIAVSSAILLLSSSLLLYFLYESLKTDRNRRRAEHALELSEERYRLLVESAGECIFMGLEKDILFANHSLLDLLGYSPEEFSRLDTGDFVNMTQSENEAGGSYIRRLLRGESVPQRYETSLKARDGSIHDVTLSLSNVVLQQHHGFIAIASEITPRRAREIEQEKIMTDLQSLVFFLDRPAGEICLRQFHIASFDEPVASVAGIIKDRDIAVVAVRDSKGKISGLITREAVLRHLTSCQHSGSTLIGNLTGNTPGTVIEKSPAYEAYIRIEQTGDPVQVIDHAGEMVGVIRERELLLLQRYSPTLLQQEIEAAGSSEDLVQINQRLPELIRILVRTGMRTAHVNQIITLNTRSILRKALELAFKKLGPAPCEFDFMVLGSEGRYEQTLRTDQDNALIYRDPPPEMAEIARNYFQALGTEVCDTLNDVGYTWCQGGIMAKNPEWNQSVSGWKETFSRWLNALEAEDLLMARIFFDFRTGSGKGELVDQLKSYLDGMIDEEPRFFYLLARNGLIYEPPVSRFGNFILSDVAGENKGLDIKSAMTLIVDFARIYSLKHHIWVTNTRDRLMALSEKGVITAESAGEIVQAYDYLMQIRIENQVRSLERYERPGNFIDPESLTSIDQRMLKEVFNQIRHFQAKLSYDFTGTMQHG